MLAYLTAIYPNHWRIKLQQNFPTDLSFPLQFICQYAALTRSCQHGTCFTVIIYVKQGAKQIHVLSASRALTMGDVEGCQGFLCGC